MLKDLPLVMPLARWIWAAESDLCLDEIPMLGGHCFSLLLTKALGTAIILGACLNKAPIMINMMNNKSAAGISRSSLYGEAIVYGCGVCYGYLMHHPFTAYGENLMLLLQNIALVVLSWQYATSPVLAQEKIMAVAGLGAFVFGVLNFLPTDYQYMLMSATWPVLLYARGTQVLETYQVKHTGQLSIVTTGMNLVGALIRIGTTLQETGDTVVLFGFLLSLVLSLTMFLQYFLYLENTKKLSTKDDDKKDK